VLTAAIRAIGYLQCALDSCIFYLRAACINSSFPDPELRSNKLPLWLVLRTDDILVFCFTKQQSDNLEGEFRKTFNLTNLGEVKVFCGLEFYRDARGIIVHQHTYCKGILEDFGFINPKPSRVPGTTANIVPMPEDAPLRKFALPSLIGSLTWPATQTRPDIAFDVNNASVTSAHQPAIAYAMCSRILRYIVEPRGLLFPADVRPDQLLSYSDSNLGGCLFTRRSRTGQVHILTGAPVAWSSKRQSTVALSTMDAECIANSDTARVAIAIQNFCAEIGYVISLPSVMFNDNRGAILAATNGLGGQRTRHLDIKHHYLIEQVRAGRLVLRHVPSADNIADILTKPLTPTQFATIVDNITVRLTNAIPNFRP